MYLDIIYIYSTSSRRLGARAIGVDADQYDEMPGVVLTSMLKRVDVVVFEMIREATLGQYVRGASGLRTFGLAEGGVDWVHDGPHARGLRPEVIARVKTPSPEDRHPRGERERLFFEARMRVLDRDLPGYAD